MTATKYFRLAADIWGGYFKGRIGTARRDALLRVLRMRLPEVTL